MDIVKRIDDLKKIIESGKFDTKYAGFTKTEVLLNQHVLTVCESIYEYGKDIAAKITFAYSDPKTGLSKLSEMVIAKAGTPLNEIKEMGILSVMGIKINSNVTVNEEKENVVAVESEKVEKTTEETEEETETEVVVESKEVEKTTEETKEVEVVEENTENTKTVEKTEETKAEEKVTTEENNNDKIKDVTHSADDVEDVLTDNASEIFDKTPSPEDPLNKDFTENVPVGKVAENKVNEENKTEESNEIEEEFIKTVEKIIETKEKTENENKKTEEKVSPVKEENSSDKEDVPEYKKKELDSIQKGEIDVLVKHLTANKQDKKEVLEKFFKRLDYNKSLKKENSEEILEILVKESQRLANRYTEEILNLMFDEAYKGLIPETQGENLLMNIGNLKVLAVATAIAICEIVLYEMKYL